MVFRFLSLFVIFLFCVSPVLGGGISPGRYDFDFHPGYKASFPFTFVSSDPEAHFTIAVKGDLREFVKLSDSTIGSSGTVIAYVTLPQTMDKPGTHRIAIAGTEVGSQEGFGITGEARGLIFIHVPYPGEYLELSVESRNINEGEDVPLTIILTNRGTSSVTPSLSADVYTPHNQLIERVPLTAPSLVSGESQTLTPTIDTSSYASGRYTIRVSALYGDHEVGAETSFRVGTLHVDIVNYTSSFTRDTINSFSLTVESQWNDRLEGVFANVTILGTDVFFLTPTVELEPFGFATLTGYFDTTLLPPEPFQARVLIHYAGTMSESIVNLDFESETNLLYIVAGSALALIIIGLIFFLRKRHPRRKAR